MHRIYCIEYSALITMHRMQFIHYYVRLVYRGRDNFLKKRTQNFRYETILGKMAHYEIDSFVIKFKQLWLAGTKATLKIEAVDGQASVILTAGLGHPPPLAPGPHGHDQPPRQHRGPAYLRRQERRKAAVKLLTLCLLSL